MLLLGHCSKTISDGNEASQIKWRPKRTSLCYSASFKSCKGGSSTISFDRESETWVKESKQNIKKEVTRNVTLANSTFAFVVCMNVAVRAIEMNLSISPDSVNAVNFASFVADQFEIVNLW